MSSGFPSTDKNRALECLDATRFSIQCEGAYPSAPRIFPRRFREKHRASGCRIPLVACVTSTATDAATALWGEEEDTEHVNLFVFEVAQWMPLTMLHRQRFRGPMIDERKNK